MIRPSIFILHLEHPLQLIATFIQNIRHAVSGLRYLDLLLKCLRKHLIRVKQMPDSHRRRGNVSSVIARIMPASFDLADNAVIFPQHRLPHMTAGMLVHAGILLVERTAAALKIQCLYQIFSQLSVNVLPDHKRVGSLTQLIFQTISARLRDL